MRSKNVLYNLQQRNDYLKSRLTHEQLRHDNFSFGYFRKYSSRILNEYRKHNSIFKASQIVGIDYNTVMDWYVQGQLNNPQFRGFYLSINEINNNRDVADEIKNEIEVNEDVENFDEGYIISEYGDGWSYKTYVDGEKIFLISNDLKTLKKKVRDRHLPLD